MATHATTTPDTGKKKHVETESPHKELERCKKRKKRKLARRKCLFSSFPPEFYDSLSKVRLTNRALRELDRRNQLDNRSALCKIPSAPKTTCGRPTRKDIQQFAAHGGPELCDLRGYPQPAGENAARRMRSNGGSSVPAPSARNRTGLSVPALSQPADSDSDTDSDSATDSDVRTKGSSAYDPDFEQHLIDHNIFIDGYANECERTKPSNLNDIRRKLGARRASLSPQRFTESDFMKYKNANHRVILETDVMRDVLPYLLGESDIPNRQNLLFTRLSSITNYQTIRPQPDFYDGSRLEDINSRVWKDIDDPLPDAAATKTRLKTSFLIPTNHRKAPVAPNFFLEGKAPRGGLDIAKRQACHDAAVGARAMHKLQSYGEGEPTYDNNAYTLSATFHGGTLVMYAVYIALGPGGEPEYHMSNVEGYYTLSNSDGFRQAATLLRNGRDEARKWRDGFVSAANKKAKSR